MHACMYACMHVCMDACMHACMRACVHACMHACMYVCVYVYIYIWYPDILLAATFKFYLFTCFHIIQCDHSNYTICYCLFQNPHHKVIVFHVFELQFKMCSIVVQFSSRISKFLKSIPQLGCLDSPKFSEGKTTIFVVPLNKPLTYHSPVLIQIFHVFLCCIFVFYHQLAKTWPILTQMSIWRCLKIG